LQQKTLNIFDEFYPQENSLANFLEPLIIFQKITFYGKKEKEKLGSNSSPLLGPATKNPAPPALLARARRLLGHNLGLAGKAVR